MYSADDVANLIYGHTNWNGEPIRVLACSAGRYNNGFAAQLADIMEVKVLAPILDLWVNAYTYELLVCDADPAGFDPDYALFNPDVQAKLWQSFPKE